MPTLTSRVTGNGQATGGNFLDQLTPGLPLRRRNWPRVGAAVALAVFCGALFVLLYSSAGARRPYLAVAQPLAAGETTTAADLTTARVQSDPALSPIPAGEAGAVIGRRAAVALVPGTLLTPADLASGPLLAPDEASVGLDLKPGEVPGDLVAGDTVVVIDTAAAAGQGALVAPDVLVSQATVLSVLQPTANSPDGDTEVTVGVPADIGAAVATAASAGNVAIAGLGSGGGSS